MSYRTLAQAVRDLQRTGQLVVLDDEIDPDQEMAAVHRRIFAASGPAVLYRRVRGTSFPAVSNLFGTVERARFLLRHAYRSVEALIAARATPELLATRPLQVLRAARAALHALPVPALARGVRVATTNISNLPMIRAWPRDGGAYVFLPQVCTTPPGPASLLRANIGMYRVQMTGEAFHPDEEMGLHYQIHRGIGVHHTAYALRGEPMSVSIFVGGPPAHTLAAIMPLPEGLPEAAFAGALAGRNFRYVREGSHLISTDADFCILGEVEPGRVKPEGPFGDHLGYYSLAHDFPLLNIKKIYHRKDAIWPFTIVGRPPQEDTVFGHLIHELTAPMAPRVLPGVQGLHAVDAAGVHPLLLAVGSERYAPFSERRPMELNTIACSILGFGQASLAKYLFLAAGEDQPPDMHDIIDFVQHILRRIDFKRDIHFHTGTTIDTLDYSGTGLNEGSKMVLVAAGAERRVLADTWTTELRLPSYLYAAGILLLEGPPFQDYSTAAARCPEYAGLVYETYRASSAKIALVILVDDISFCKQNINNLLWVAFTRSNPSHDVYGGRAEHRFKHWECDEPLLIDARSKPHHAPPLEEDPEITRRMDRWFGPGRPLHPFAA
ncbi:MAG: UbiD family decarboxylase [Spirochaetales bacterium]|nr:UbiD family decarboxylase [Spirochaetales bacterium]